MTKEDWLNEFFGIVDRNRLSRGKKMYRDQHLKSLKEHHGGFYAVVRGSRAKNYEVHAQFPVDEKGIPELEGLTIECSCKDWVEFCKHSICAVISYCEGEMTGSRKDLLDHETVTAVETLMTRNMDQLIDLGPLPVLGKERSFDKMQYIVQKKLREEIR